MSNNPKVSEWPVPSDRPLAAIAPDTAEQNPHIIASIEKFLLQLEEGPYNPRHIEVIYVEPTCDNLAGSLVIKAR